jgi:hypothetical protein
MAGKVSLPRFSRILDYAYAYGVAKVPELATSPVTFQTVDEIAVNLRVVPIRPPVVVPFIVTVTSEVGSPNCPSETAVVSIIC